ncbi:trypsin-like serine peptidase [Parvularcula marina]|uniref:Peptidase S1 domain-containing protein n=1 Tax=Parvularcula marina TaxID=2292771 RepID=A0A371REJ9_9PROT|nr:trypsin-like serine protease [Parvularcula marina]RFB03869.1 hypothetical protein DX908_00365 [Parvularcula marina]
MLLLLGSSAAVQAQEGTSGDGAFSTGQIGHEFPDEADLYNDEFVPLFPQEHDIDDERLILVIPEREDEDPALDSEEIRRLLGVDPPEDDPLDPLSPYDPLQPVDPAGDPLIPDPSTPFPVLPEEEPEIASDPNDQYRAVPPGVGTVTGGIAGTIPLAGRPPGRGRGLPGGNGGNSSRFDATTKDCDKALSSFDKYQSQTIQTAREKAAARKFFDNCMPASERSSTSQRLGWPLGAWELSRRVVVIFLWDDASSPDLTKPIKGHCTGFLLDKDTVLTAAHCLDTVNADYEIQMKPGMNCTSFGVEVEADLAGATRQRIKLKQNSRHANADIEGCPFPKFDAALTQNDIVLLKLANAAAGIEPFKQTPLVTGLVPGTGLYVIGLHPFRDVFSDTPRLTLKWSNSCRVMIDPNSPMIRKEKGVEDIPYEEQQADELKGKLLHQCYTHKGMSGGPVFVRDADGYLKLIGIHQSAAVNLSGCMASYARTRARPVGWCSRNLSRYSFLNAGHLVVAQP